MRIRLNEPEPGQELNFDERQDGSIGGQRPSQRGKGIEVKNVVGHDRLTDRLPGNIFYTREELLNRLIR